MRMSAQIRHLIARERNGGGARTRSLSPLRNEKGFCDLPLNLVPAPSQNLRVVKNCLTAAAAAMYIKIARRGGAEEVGMFP